MDLSHGAKAVFERTNDWQTRNVSQGVGCGPYLVYKSSIALYRSNWELPLFKFKVLLKGISYFCEDYVDYIRDRMS